MRFIVKEMAVVIEGLQFKHNDLMSSTPLD